jgi:hypothetical protein
MPISAAPPAPAVRAPRATKTTTKSVQEVKSKADQRAEGLLGIAQIGHSICLLGGQYADAGAIQHFAPNLCIETAKLGDRYEKFGASLDVLSEIGPFTAVLAAALPFGMQILANHGRLDADKLAGSGVMHPDTLAALTKAEVDKQRAEALRQQREAEEALLRAQSAVEFEDGPSER